MGCITDIPQIRWQFLFNAHCWKKMRIGKQGVKTAILLGASRKRPAFFDLCSEPYTCWKYLCLLVNTCWMYTCSVIHFLRRYVMVVMPHKHGKHGTRNCISMFCWFLVTVWHTDGHHRPLLWMSLRNNHFLTELKGEKRWRYWFYIWDLAHCYPSDVTRLHLP